MDDQFRKQIKSNTGCVVVMAGSGSFNAYIANPKNAGRFVAQIYADVNPEIARRLNEERRVKIKSLEQDDERLLGESIGASR